MAGTPRFKTNAYLDSAAYGTLLNLANGLFKLTWDFFKHLETNGICTEIARNDGDFMGSEGTDFWDGGAPFSDGAWALFRMDSNGGRSWPYYVFFQMSGAGTFNGTTGSPGLINNGTGAGASLGFQVAVARDSNGDPASPWNGTTGNIGDDTKGDPVWAAPAGGTLQVLTISNETGGDHATSKQNCVGVDYSGAVVSWRCHFLADDDNIAIAFNPGDDGTFPHNFYIFIGQYTPMEGLDSVIDDPLAMFSTWSSATEEWFTAGFTVPFGTVAGDAVREGGIVHRPERRADAVSPSRPDTSAFDRHDNSSEADVAPSDALVPISLWTFQRFPRGFLGYMDYDFFQQSYNRRPRVDDFDASSKAMFGGAINTPRTNVVVPWDGTTMGTGTVRGGAVS